MADLRDRTTMRREIDVYLGFDFAHKEEDETRTTTTLADDGDLVLELEPGSVYLIEGFIMVTGDAAEDLSHALGVPSGSIIQWTGSDPVVANDVAPVTVAL